MTIATSGLKKIIHTQGVYIIMSKKKFIARVFTVAATLFVGMSTASANVVENIRDPFSFTFSNSCTGEEVYVEGIFHIVSREKFRKDGTGYIDSTINAHGFGVGLTSGADYVFKDNTFTGSVGIPGDSFTFELSQFLRFIGKGRTPNELIELDVLLRFEFNPFSVTVDVSQDVRCLPD